MQFWPIFFNGFILLLFCLVLFHFSSFVFVGKYTTVSRRLDMKRKWNELINNVKCTRNSEKQKAHCEFRLNGWTLGRFIYSTKRRHTHTNTDTNSCGSVVCMIISHQMHSQGANMHIIGPHNLIRLYTHLAIFNIVFIDQMM